MKSPFVINAWGKAFNIKIIEHIFPLTVQRVNLIDYQIFLLRKIKTEYFITLVHILVRVSDLKALEPVFEPYMMKNLFLDETNPLIFEKSLAMITWEWLQIQAQCRIPQKEDCRQEDAPHTPFIH